MSSSTYASVIVEEQYVEQARKDLGEAFFSAKLSETGELPATHFISSGYFFDSELDFIINEAVWKKLVKFGDVQNVLSALNLKPVSTVSESQPE